MITLKDIQADFNLPNDAIRLSEISPIFWTTDGKFSFQKVGSLYRLYGENGYFLDEFRSFKAMYIYITLQSNRG